MHRIPTFVALFCLAICAGCPADNSQQSTPTEPDTNAAPASSTEQLGTPPDVTMEETQQEVGEAADAVGKLAEQKTAEALKAARTSYEDAKQKIAELRVKMDDLQGAAREEVQKTLDSLDAKAAEAEKKLQQLGSASGEAWKEAQDDVSNAMSDLEKAYQEAMKAFEKSADKSAEGDKTGDVAKDPANE